MPIQGLSFVTKPRLAESGPLAAAVRSGRSVPHKGHDRGHDHGQSRRQECGLPPTVTPPLSSRPFAAAAKPAAEYPQRISIRSRRTNVDNPRLWQSVRSGACATEGPRGWTADAWSSSLISVQIT